MPAKSQARAPMDLSGSIPKQVCVYVCECVHICACVYDCVCKLQAVK